MLTSRLLADPEPADPTLTSRPLTDPEPTDPTLTSRPLTDPEPTDPTLTSRPLTDPEPAGLATRNAMRGSHRSGSPSTHSIPIHRAAADTKVKLSQPRIDLRTYIA
ncbi:hypothetical protein Areg01_84140 [Actinoplanes regularis]|nr:hypothetical protein Areg01_84140 [Actinoplanes regularis]